MRLHEIRIRNIRGIRKLDLTPEGRSAVILGENGTGKSAIVDAIDFLLTGEIDRLKGRKGVSQKRHGRHISSVDSEAYVEARITIPGSSEQTTIRRNFSSPGKLEIPSAFIPLLQPFLQVATQRQHILTRANILRFISSAPKDRATLVQAILNLDRVEEVRQTLTKAARSEKSRFEGVRNERISAEGAISASLSLPKYSASLALEAINRIRATLGGEKVETVANAKRDLLPPAISSSDSKTTSLYNDVNSLRTSLTGETQNQLDAWDATLREMLCSLNEDPTKLRAARQVELVELGIKSLDNSGLCPLCDTEWGEQPLKTYLFEKLEAGKEIAPIWRQVRNISDSLLQWVADHPVTLDRVITAGRQVDGGTDPTTLNSFKVQLNLFKKALADPLSTYAQFRKAESTLSEQLGLVERSETLRLFNLDIPNDAKVNPLQVAWDTLTKVEENIKALVKATDNEVIMKKSAQRTETARAAFVAARDEVLTDLYESVKGRFVSLYKKLHSDEQDFSATLEPNVAGLNLEVDFYGTGAVAPFALHSEGHQDSMGLCLFLALAEKVEGTRLGFCLLDDVVTSVDVGHRSDVARLLAELKGATQFIITTHDQVWAMQLQSNRCATSSDTTRLISWSLDGGTVVSNYSNFLEEVAKELELQRVSSAAAALREGLESYFHFVADAIGAEVPYSLSGKYDLGQVFTASCGKLSKLLKKAKDAAQSWKQDEQFEILCELDTRRKEVLQNADVERWSINAKVHFNQWMNMTSKEFKPVVEAFTEVCKLFQCPTCESILSVVREGIRPVSVKCLCGETTWNLEKSQ